MAFRHKPHQLPAPSASPGGLSAHQSTARLDKAGGLRRLLLVTTSHASRLLVLCVVWVAGPPLTILPGVRRALCAEGEPYEARRHAVEFLSLWSYVGPNST